MEQLANNAATTLNGSISNTDTSIVVTDGSVFPSSGNFRLLVQNEIILCTARSSNTLTVTRGQESTTAASHATALPIELVYTKGSFETILSDFWTSGGYASRPSAPRAGAMYMATDLIDARWMYNGSNWDLINPIVVPYAKRADFSGWTSSNMSTSTTTDKNGILHANIQSASTNVRILYKTKPSSPFKFTIAVNPLIWGFSFCSVSLGVRINTGAFRNFSYLSRTNNEGVFLYEYWNSPTNFNSDIMSARITAISAPIWLRFEDDNTNWMLWTSRDGKTYTKVFSETRNTGFTADQIMVGWFNNVALSGTPPLDSYILSEWEE